MDTDKDHPEKEARSVGRRKKDKTVVSEQMSTLFSSWDLAGWSGDGFE